jgi:hypothetical protein
MKRRTAALVTACALMLPAQVWAQMTLEGQTFEATQKVGDADLVLNGVGVRSVLFVKAYVAGLYVPQKSTSDRALLASKGPKRVQIRLLRDTSASTFHGAFKRGIDDNTTDAEEAALRSRMEQFEKTVNAIGEAKKGDVVNMDLIPGRGLAVSVNGQARGAVVPGDDFSNAVLRIFIGEKPADTTLKRGLLGGS